MKQVTVEVGDSLSLIAQRELGDGMRWPEIFRANPSHFYGHMVDQMVTKHPRFRREDCIFPGQVLLVPERT